MQMKDVFMDSEQDLIERYSATFPDFANHCDVDKAQIDETLQFALPLNRALPNTKPVSRS